MRVILRLGGIRFGGARRWWAEPRHLEQVFRSAREAGLWPDAAHYRRGSDAPPQEVESAERLLDESATWESATHYVQSGADDEPPASLDLEIEPGSLELRYRLDESGVEALAATAVARLIEFTSSVHEALHEAATFGPRLLIELYDLPYRRVRPPRYMYPWGQGSAANFICRKSFENSEVGTAQDLERIVRAPMPAGTERSERGDLIILRWVKDLTDPADVARRRSLQEQWFANVLNLRPDSGYNRHGDRVVTALAQEPKPPLTFYDSSSETGYKAVALAPDGSTDEELFAEMEEWIDAGRLPDGTPLSQLNLILPSREAALRLRARASAAGFGAVLYIDEEGALWDPSPPGLWME
jgi:hypothetical protein